ncbi:hypothetical protein ES707_00337 [subsurface metagenome]
MQYARPVSDIENPGGWATAPLWEKLDEEPFDDADYIESPKSATGASFTIGLSGVIDPEVHTDHIIRIRVKTGVSGTFRYELMQGAVVIKDSGDVVLSTVETEYNMMLSEAEAGNISDYEALSLRGTAVATQKNQRQNVSWIRVDVPNVAGEEHSGSGSISGKGSIAGTAKKGGQGSALISAGGTLLAIGLAGMMGIASIVGRGSVIATGEATVGAEEHSGVAAISGNGILAGIGTKQARGNSAITAKDSISANGEANKVEEYSGIAAITGRGMLVGLGTKSAEGIGTISGTGTITVGEEAPAATATGTQVSREKRGLLLIANPDAITFIGKKKPVLISKK